MTVLLRQIKRWPETPKTMRIARNFAEIVPFHKISTPEN